MKRKFGNPDDQSAERVKSSIQNERVSGRGTWLDYDSSLSNYEASFFGVMPPAERNKGGLKDYVESFLSERKGKANGIDLGNSGSRLFQGFSPGFFSKTVGVALVDVRHEAEIAEDAAHNHLVLAADIANPRTPVECRKLFKGEKIDVIFERMMGGLYNLPSKPSDLGKILDLWYRLLNDKALLFAQYEPSWSNEVSLLGDRIKRDFAGRLEFQTDDYYFRLTKFPGAPETLPLLAEK